MAWAMALLHGGGARFGTRRKERALLEFRASSSIWPREITTSLPPRTSSFSHVAVNTFLKLFSSNSKKK